MEFPALQMQNLAGSDLWYAPARIEPVGRLHSFHYLIDGANGSTKFGGRLDLPAFAPFVLPATRSSIGHAFSKDLAHQ